MGVIVPPQYRLTTSIAQLLQELALYKNKLDSVPQPQFVEKQARQKGILKSAVYSARIEGNPKTLEDVSHQNIRNTKEKHKRELWNLVRALEFVLSRSWKHKVSMQNLKALHLLVLKDLSLEAGKFRHVPSAIYNRSGHAIYVCPPPQEIASLLKSLLKYINEKNEPFAPVKAALAHYTFERIHPFLDGNGRVGRLLIHLILKKWKFDLRGLVAFEEYFDTHRPKYYNLLTLPEKDLTPLIHFFLNGLRVALNEAVQVRQEIGELNREDLLPPRRYEILGIIRDHRQVSFEFVRRRFLAVSDRLLRYDLKKLQDAGFVKKRGVTKGAVYEPIE